MFYSFLQERGQLRVLYLLLYQFPLWTCLKSLWSTPILNFFKRWCIATCFHANGNGRVKPFVFTAQLDWDSLLQREVKTWWTAKISANKKRLRNWRRGRNTVGIWILKRTERKSWSWWQEIRMFTTETTKGTHFHKHSHYLELFIRVKN